MSSLQEKLKQPFTRDIVTNMKTIESVFANDIDVLKRDFFFHENKSIPGVCFYTDGLANTQQVEEIIKSLSLYKGDEILNSEGGMAETIKKNLLINASVMIIDNFEKGINGILMGDTVVLLSGSRQAFLITTRGWDTRSVTEPQTEQVVRGPRDGFTESIRTNTALVRRRIRDPQLRIEGMQIGKKSKTDINIVYLEGTVKEGLVKEVKKRLEQIKIDAVLESGYIEELIRDSPWSPFTTIQNTERPDKVAAGILEGRIAIFVDNTPFVLIVPTYFWEFIQASDDYYSGFMAGSFFRIVRYLAFIISLTLPSIYIMLVSFHQEMIPTELALTIASGREVVPFPVLVEALIMEIAFELMREAGLRMPKPVGQAVSIVGSLVIGQAAVQAGVVSPFMVIIIALTGIASFAIPNYSASISIRLIRFPLLIASGTLGLMGFSAVFALIAIHALSIRSFGEPYLAPAAPFQPSDQKDIILRFPWWKMDKQPYLAEGTEDRAINNLEPKPPEKSPDSKQAKKGKQ
ncbi:spore germination protein [Niallia oryzisoli]|uniref:spore germination protein n=1 Tax=Niallia oryzisoli TaxID=1737571 RepID=UPI003735AB9E